LGEAQFRKRSLDRDDLGAQMFQGDFGAGPR
jgi:hypothetical protein